MGGRVSRQYNIHDKQRLKPGESQPSCSIHGDQGAKKKLLADGVVEPVEEVNAVVESPSLAKLDGLNGNGKKLMDKIQELIKRGDQRRNEEFIRGVFDEFAEKEEIPKADNTPHEKYLTRSKLRPVFEALGLFDGDSVEKWEILFNEVDLDNNGRISWDEFYQAVQKPSKVEQWAQMIGFWQPISDIVCAVIKHREGSNSDPLKEMSLLSRDDVEIIASAFSNVARTILLAEVDKLRVAFQAVDSSTSRESQLAQVGSQRRALKFSGFEMNSGNIDDFFSGLAGRVGDPQLKFFDAMEAEHCSHGPSCRREFTAVNYGLTSTPEREWGIVALNVQCPREQLGHGRRIPDLGALFISPTALAAGLQREEVIALVLYTGPMYIVYNTVLRRGPADRFQPFELDNNLFPTTIFALSSAVQKLARSAKVPHGLTLYRGLGGRLELPVGFLQPDAHGCLGFAEWGFMSTTSDKKVAVMYSARPAGTGLRMVLVLRSGAVDRGARVVEFSQYPAEVEYLWPPCSFVQPESRQWLEVGGDGVVQMVSVRINANLRTETLEGLLASKKNMHLASFRFQLRELKVALEAMAEEGGAIGRAAADPSVRYLPVKRFLQSIMTDCSKIFSKHEAMRPEAYTDDEVFRSLVIEMLDIRRMAVAKVELWLADSSLYLSGVTRLSLRQAHLQLISFLASRLESLRSQTMSSSFASCLPSSRSSGETAPLAGVGEAGSLVPTPSLSCRARRYMVMSASSAVALSHQSSFALPRSLPALALKLCKLKGLVKRLAIEANEQGEAKIISAASSGWDTRDLRLLVDARADVRATGLRGRTAAMLAAQYGHAATMETLVELGADLAAADDGGETAVMLAAAGGHTAIVQRLLGLKAEVNGRDAHGSTAAMAAAEGGHLETLRVLYELKADLHVKDNHLGVALMLAAGGGHTEVVERLLAWGADPLEEDINGWSAVCYAAHGGHRDTVAALGRVGVAVPGEPWAALECDACCWRGCVCGGIGRDDPNMLAGPPSARSDILEI